MKYYYFIVKSDDRVVIMSQEGREFDLDTLRQGVGGCIEIVRPVRFLQVSGEHSVRMVVDDEGKLKGKNYNAAASAMYSPECDLIVGDAILCTEILTDEGPDVGLFCNHDLFNMMRYIKKIAPQVKFEEASNEDN